MSFLFPAALSWAWLLLPLVLLFLVRRPPQQRRVPSLLLFHLLAGSRTASRVTSRKKWLALLLAVTTLLLVITALAGPVLGPTAAPSEVEAGAADRVPTEPVLEALPIRRRLRVLWMRKQSEVDPFTALALSALDTDGSIEAFESDPSAQPGNLDRYDILLLDGWLPSAWPDGLPLLILNPPHALGPLDLTPIAGHGLRVQRLDGVDTTHPVLSGVPSERVTLMQTSTLEASPSLPALWTGPAGPLLLAGQSQGRRIIVFSFAPARSEQLGLLGAYPVLLGNALAWLGEAEGEQANPKVVAPPAETTAAARTPGARGPGRRGVPFALLIQLALFLLVLEAWLYHRHAVS